MQSHLSGNLSLLVVQRAQHAAPPAGELSLPVAQRVQHATPPAGESFSPGATELNFQPHQSVIRTSLQQNAQTFFTQQRSRTYEALSPSAAHASTATVAMALIANDH